jgi:hypothetical protein
MDSYMTLITNLDDGTYKMVKTLRSLGFRGRVILLTGGYTDLLQSSPMFDAVIEKYGFYIRDLVDAL